MLNSEAQNSVGQTNQPSSTSSSSAVNSSTDQNQVTVPVMKQYSDPEVGFSFWYPSNWQVTRNEPSQDSDSNITQGNVLATLVIGPTDEAGNVDPQISIQEVLGNEAVITDTFGTGSNQTYYFNFTTHTWMTTPRNYSSEQPSSAADVSNNTMGGLHMLGGSGQYDTAIIIPLSARNFLVVNKIGRVEASPLAKTILALDPAVATPVSASLQKQTVNDEAVAYSVLPGITWKTYNDSQTGISFQYPSDFGGYPASLQGQNGIPQILVTPTGANIDEHGCYIDNSGPRGYMGGTPVAINSLSFCLSTGGDVGAGQSYRDYYYTTRRNGTYITLGYTIHTSNGCGVFKGDPNYVSCEYFFQNFDNIVTKAIQKSAGSLTFAR